MCLSVRWRIRQVPSIDARAVRRKSSQSVPYSEREICVGHEGRRRAVGGGQHIVTGVGWSLVLFQGVVFVEVWFSSKAKDQTTNKDQRITKVHLATLTPMSRVVVYVLTHHSLTRFLDADKLDDMDKNSMNKKVQDMVVSSMNTLFHQRGMNIRCKDVNDCAAMRYLLYSTSPMHREAQHLTFRISRNWQK